MCSLVETLKRKNIMPLEKTEKLLFSDDCKTQFLLTRKLEVYLYDSKTLTVLIFRNSKNVFEELKKLGAKIIMECDDNIYECHIGIEKLPDILAIGKIWKNRPHLKGKFIKQAEELLGHKIKPYQSSVIDSQIKLFNRKEGKIGKFKK